MTIVLLGFFVPEIVQNQTTVPEYFSKGSYLGILTNIKTSESDVINIQVSDKDATFIARFKDCNTAFSSINSSSVTCGEEQYNLTISSNNTDGVEGHINQGADKPSFKVNKQ